MHKSGTAVGFWSAVAMGVGAMVGAGIFAILGEAGAIARSAVWISFILAGGVALLSGYSFGRLGARYPSAGGLVEYLVQAYGKGRFSGAMSVTMYLATLVALSLVARTFGAYAHALIQDLIPGRSPAILVEVFAISVVLLFVLVNLNGARSMAVAENLTVLIKLILLAFFALAGLVMIDPAKLAPATYPHWPHILYSIAITFYAYEGFRVITNAAEDMPDPGRDLPRAIMTSILIVMVLYVVVALAVFGNLPAASVIAAKEYALAEAARPAFGAAGFVIVGISALIATTSTMNASLFAVTNVTYRLAMLGKVWQTCRS